MSGLTLDRLWLPLALVAIVIAAVVFLPREEDKQAAAAKSPSPSVIVGQPGGEVIATPSATAVSTPVPTVAAATTPPETPAPTPPPPQAGFTAQILACESISGSTCNNQLGTLAPGAGQFTALVLFTDATAGDTFNAVLNGPSGTIPGGPFTLQGGGDGYYYSTFTAGNLPPGDYTLVAVRNGSEVATTSFTRG